MTFAEKFREAQKNFKGLFFGFELFNIETQEYEYGDITYNENTNILSWRDFSIEADNFFNVDANLEALKTIILESEIYE